MTSAVQPATADSDWRNIVPSGVKIGVVTAVGVMVFALLSRSMVGTAETVVQSILILLGGAAFAYLPSVFVRPRDVDSIAWAVLVGLLGALTFTVIDTALFRPIDLYHWTWDAIGGGSGFWYIPVWWMGSAFLAWLGSWVIANIGGEGEPNVVTAAAQTIGMGFGVTAILMMTGLVPFHAAGTALGFTVGLVLHVFVSGVLRKG